MFCVVECETVPPLRRVRLFRRRRANGWRAAWHSEPRYYRLTLEFPLGAPPKLLRDCAAAAFSAASNAGCAGVVLPRDFPFPALPGEFGMAVSTPVPLYRRLAGRICVWTADRLQIPRERLQVAIAGRRITAELLQTAALLRHRARGFSVDAGADTEALRSGLARHYGISAPGGLHRQAGLYVLFDLPDKAFSVPDDAWVLNFSGREPAVYGGRMADGALLESPRALQNGWPEHCDTAALLSALAAHGALRYDEIYIRGLSRGGHAISL